MIRIRQTSTALDIVHHRIRTRFPIRNGRLLPMEITCTRSRRVLGRSLYFLLWSTPDKKQRVKSARNFTIHRDHPGQVRLDINVSLQKKLQAQLRLVFTDDPNELLALTISAQPDPGWQDPFAFRILGLVPGEPTSQVRLCGGLFSGWTIGKQTMLMYSQQPLGERQMAITIDPDDVKLGRGEFSKTDPVQCAPLAIGYPPALTRAWTHRWDDLDINGAIALAVSDTPIGDPKHHVTARALDNESRCIKPGRYGLQRYLDDYLTFLKHPEMFIEIGDGCGLYHRGFYNCTTRGTFASPNSEDNKKQYAGALMYRHPAIDKRRKKPEDYPHMQVFGEYSNMAEPLCDMVWGGAHNLQTALFLFKNKALIPQANKIVQATIRYRNERGEGFQIDDGPTRGAWWNAYQPWRQDFSSRYYEPTVGMPDQGLFNYYLCEMYQRGDVSDPHIVDSVRRNCEQFLRPHLERAGGQVFHVYDTTGNVGYTREKRIYPTPSPCGTLLASLGLLCGYRLTGHKSWRDMALRMAKSVVENYIQKYQWGYLEYDTMGADTMGMGRMLLALCELYREQPVSWLRDAAHVTLHHLYAHQHHRDLDFTRYMNNEQAWGGTPYNYGGFIHGYTYNSPQGLGALTFRSDLSEGLLAAVNTFNDPTAYESLVKYLNCLTWHQVVRQDIPFGYGSTSEHLNLKADYVQDTFQVSNAMPFGIEDILNQFAITSCNQPIGAISLHQGKLCVRFDVPTKTTLQFTVNIPAGYDFTVVCKGKQRVILTGRMIQIPSYGGEPIEVRTQ